MRLIRCPLRSSFAPSQRLNRNAIGNPGQVDASRAAELAMERIAFTQCRPRWLFSQATPLDLGDLIESSNRAKPKLYQADVFGEMKPLIAVLVALLIALGLAAPRPSYAGHDDGQKHDQGKHVKGHKHGGSEYDYEPHHYAGPYFTSQRVAVIRNYYTPVEIDRLPPGLRKRLLRTGHLPPGLEKKLSVGQPVPPAYLNYMVPAPPALLGTLGPLPPDSQLYFYNGDGVLIDPRTQAVLEIIHGVLTLGAY